MALFMAITLLKWMWLQFANNKVFLRHYSFKAHMFFRMSNRQCFPQSYVVLVVVVEERYTYGFINKLVNNTLHTINNRLMLKLRSYWTFKIWVDWRCNSMVSFLGCVLKAKIYPDGLHKWTLEYMWDNLSWAQDKGQNYKSATQYRSFSAVETHAMKLPAWLIDW